MAKAQRKTIDKIFIMIGGVAAVALLIVSAVLWTGYSFVKDQVTTELASQKITFPPKGPALDPAEFPELQQYAGQPVDDGIKAKAYANNFIGKHLEKAADGKTYAEISSAALKDKDNIKLQAQKQTLFQGETLRGLLLNAYAFWTFGTLALYASIISFAGAVIMSVLVLLGSRHLMKLK